MSAQFESVTGSLGLAFPEYDAPPPEPMPLVQKWTASAVESGVREPMALALATADARGRPSSRTVAVMDVSDAGLLFTTHSTSRKGRDIAATGWASGLLYWRETAQQICVSGPVVRLDDEENDRLWNGRAPALHPMTAVSWQSEPFDDPERLRAEADRLAPDAPLPRPERYAGYRLAPDAVEFWSAAEDRLHRRLRYDRAATGWDVARLQP